jgi:hypothetical protein
MDTKYAELPMPLCPPATRLLRRWLGGLAACLVGTCLTKAHLVGSRTKIEPPLWVGLFTGQSPVYCTEAFRPALE